MADYRKPIPKILKWEGGFVNDPCDTGGATNKGVTIATYRKAFGKERTIEDLKTITDIEWQYIFKTMYWDKWKADEINNQSIADLLVDWTWASGRYGIILPQRVLGVKDDGVVGPKTIAAINNYPDQKELFWKLWIRRKRHFEDIAKNGKEKFLKGWLHRLEDFTYNEN